jgi:glycine/D-amino acid oxidase-like deaminating enzyme
MCSRSPLRSILGRGGGEDSWCGDLREDSPAPGLSQFGDQVGGCRPPRASVTADRVVLATNVQSHLLSSRAGPRDPAGCDLCCGDRGRCRTGWILPFGFEGAVADTRRAGDYYRRVGDRLIWGGRMTTRTAAPSTVCRPADAGGHPENLSTAWAGIPISHCWTGLMGYTRHQMPIVAGTLSRPVRLCRVWRAWAEHLPGGRACGGTSDPWAPNRA